MFGSTAPQETQSRNNRTTTTTATTTQVPIIEMLRSKTEDTNSNSNNCCHGSSSNSLGTSTVEVAVDQPPFMSVNLDDDAAVLRISSKRVTTKKRTTSLENAVPASPLLGPSSAAAAMNSKKKKQQRSKRSNNRIGTIHEDEEVSPDTSGAISTDSLLVMTKIPAQSRLLYVWIYKIRAYLIRSGLLYFIIFLVMAAGMVYGISTQLIHYGSFIDWDIERNVAFIGNTYFMVNDVPRLLEGISTGHVFQQSVLHAGSSLSGIWKTGNGMYEIWQTETAIMDTDDYGNIYDFGLCSVSQILASSDSSTTEDAMVYGNPYGTYYDDGLNPCLVNAYYSDFVEVEILQDPVQWDYVILVDQTKRMAIPDARNQTTYILQNGYAPLLQRSGAIPVLVDTHAFWSNNSNMTGLSDIPTFTKLIHEGVQSYASTLATLLPRRQKPIIAPIGIAYLVIYEENYGLWETLFLDDAIHSSKTGSYLFVTVLYTTIFQHLPPAPEFDSSSTKKYYSNNENHDSNDEEEEDYYTDSEMYYLFDDSRKLIGNSDYPTNIDEIIYIRDVVYRVVIKKYIPDSLK